MNNIQICCIDEHIYDQSEVTADICYHVSQNQPVELRLENASFPGSGEGASLASLGLYDILDHISQLWPHTPDLITIYTGNFEETHPRYRVINHPANFLVRCVIPRLRKYQQTTKQQDFKHFALLIGRPSWGRLVLASHMYDQHRSKSVCSFHYSANDRDKAHHLELDRVMSECPDRLLAIANFLQQCPLTLEQGYLRPPITTEMNSIISRIYTDFFLDIVTETYVAGLSFYPTEKTLRPLINHTPALFFAPPGYLANLRRLGFQTWSKYWSEDYDSLEGYDRIQAIQQIVDSIAQLDQKKLYSMWQDMRPILIHNSQRALTIRPQEFLLDEHNEQK